jgi:4a-hydroxytetrahydrobiopterin dehydratase
MEWHEYFEGRQHIKTPKTMWKEEDNKLKKSYSFKDFREAFAFMSKVADVVNEMDHHPYWTNMYNKVSFELNTHDAGDVVTEKDHKLASAIDRIYNA